MSDDRSEAERVVVIPYEDLSATALRGIVEETITRESTDYGAVPRSFEAKVADVMAQLRDGRAQIIFDPEHESIQLRPTRDRG
jgi:uncharacterized protein YheU (UPF0270 family)